MYREEYYKLENLVVGREYSYKKGNNEQSIYNGEITSSNKIDNSQDFVANANYVLITLKEDLEDVTADIREAYTSKNIIPDDAGYQNASSNFYYYLSGLISGREYEYIKGSNELLVFNGVIEDNPVSESGKFVANNNYVWLKGDGVKAVTAVIREANIIDAVVKTTSAHGFDGTKVRILTDNEWSRTYEITNKQANTFTIRTPEGLKTVSYTHLTLPTKA